MLTPLNSFFFWWHFNSVSWVWSGQQKKQECSKSIVPLSNFFWHANSVSHGKGSSFACFSYDIVYRCCDTAWGGYSLHPTVGLGSVMMSLPAFLWFKIISQRPLSLWECDSFLSKEADWQCSLSNLTSVIWAGLESDWNAAPSQPQDSEMNMWCSWCLSHWQ